MTHSYPTPEELKNYAQEVVPFHQINASDLEIIKGDERMIDGSLRVGYNNVEYRFRPGYINVEVTSGVWKRVNDVSDYDMNHFDAFDEGIDFEPQGNFLSTTGFVEDNEGESVQFEAYWILESVIIEN